MPLIYQRRGESQGQATRRSCVALVTPVRARFSGERERSGAANCRGRAVSIGSSRNRQSKEEGPSKVNAISSPRRVVVNKLCPFSPPPPPLGLPPPLFTLSSSVSPVFVCLLLPFFVYLWRIRKQKRDSFPSYPACVVFSLGCCVLFPTSTLDHSSPPF